MDKTVSGKSRAQNNKEKSFFVSVFIGTLIALAIGLVLLTLSGLLGLSLDDPDKFTAPLALAALFITSLLSGYISARRYGKNGLVCGAMSGILLIGILVLLAFAFGQSIRFPLFAICAPGILICAVIAGICGANAGTVKRPKHKVKF